MHLHSSTRTMSFACRRASCTSSRSRPNHPVVELSSEDNARRSPPRSQGSDYPLLRTASPPTWHRVLRTPATTNHRAKFHIDPSPEWRSASQCRTGPRHLRRSRFIFLIPHETFRRHIRRRHIPILESVAEPHCVDWLDWGPKGCVLLDYEDARVRPLRPIGSLFHVFVEDAENTHRGQLVVLQFIRRAAKRARCSGESEGALAARAQLRLG